MNYFRLVIALAAGILFFSNMALGEANRLTNDGRIKFDPCFVNGGKTIVYTVEDRPKLRCLMQLQTKDKSVERLHPGQNNSEFSATFSADGRFYAWCHNNGNLHIDLLIKDKNDGSTAKYNAGGGFAGVRSPSFAPNGSRVVFALPENGVNQQLFTVDVKAQNRIALVTDEGFNMCPRFSPDGKRIAFASTRDGNFELYTMASNGAHVQRLTEHPSLDLRPRFSHDGRRIAFTSLRDGNYEIYVANSDGSNVVRVTNNDERDDYATWHPNGKQLLVVSERRGRHDLYLIDAP
jgi:Tol biopolymer transport system component